MKNVLRAVGRILKPAAWWALRIVGWILWPLWWVCSHRPVRPVLETFGGAGLWRRASGLTHLLDKYLAMVYFASMIVSVTVWSLGWFDWKSWFVAIPIVSTQMAAQSHRDYLCVRCAEEASLDPQAEAVEKISSLRRYHRFGWQTILGSLILMTGGVILTSNWFGGAAPFIVEAAVLFGAFLPALRWSQVHARLEPWCPWCHPGRGWNGEDFEPVEPDPHGVKEPVS